MPSSEYSECSLEPCGTASAFAVDWHGIRACRRLQLCLNTLARELPFLVGRVYTDHFVRDSDLQVCRC